MADDKPQNADFIGSMVSDAKNPPETRMLTGWFGDSGDEGFRRLYTDAELNSYVDLADDAILYTEPLRDVQPAGGVIVWIKRDAALRQGGSAASRAARFLQGQVQKDFSAGGGQADTPVENVSPEKAGLRCITVAPCGEVTGFTGQCTKQPEVGGVWPCITAVPHCLEVTGFTGKCTHAPWPLPTRYAGCTILHCPTHDLTQIPHICNIVASGQPGCVVVNPPREGEERSKEDAEKLPATHIPGCGYTQSWGLCETHLLGCGYTKDWGNQCPTQAPGCGWSKNPACTDLPGCNWTRQPAICNRAAADANAFPGGGGFAAFAAEADPARRRPVDPVPIDTLLVACNPSAIDACPSQRGCPQPTQPVPACPSAIDGCPTRINCDTQAPTQFCTQFPAACQTDCGPNCQTQQLNCTQIACTQAGPQCPQNTNAQLDCTFLVTQGCAPCPTTNQPNCIVVTTAQNACNANANAQAFAAAAPRPIGPTHVGCPPSDLVACSLYGGCPSAAQLAAVGHPIPICTQGGPQCPPTPATICTQFGPCPTHQIPQCPTRQFECTMFCTQGAPGCPPTHSPACIGPVTVGGPQCPVHTGFNCPSQVCQSIACQSIACLPGGGGQQEFAAARAQAAPAIHPTIWTQIGPQCPSHLLGCTYAGPQCRTYPRGDCTFFGCPSHGVDCTVVTCTHVGPLCPPNTAATVCTQTGPQCPPHPSLQGQFCPVTELCPVTPLCPATQLCPITTGGPQCPPASGFNCPSQFGCQSIQCGQSVACVSAGCQPGGGQQQQAFAQRAEAAGAPQTPATVCTQIGPQCPSHLLGCTYAGPQCRTYPRGDCTFFGCPSHGVDCTVVTCTHVGPLCPPNTAATVCTQTGPQCPPHPSLQGQFCPVTQLCPITNGGPQCPVASGFNCPSQFGCQSIQCGQSVACVSAGCQPGGGQQQHAFAQQAVAAPQTAVFCQHTSGPTICTQIGPQCPHTAGCPTPLCTHIGPFCQHTSGPTICTQIGPQCPHTAGCPTPLCTELTCPNTLATLCTQSGPQCPPHPSLQGQLCPITPGAPQCPPASGFNCPSQLGCQSIACQSAACQPGGGEQHEFAAFGAAREAAAGRGGGIGVTAWLDCTHFGWQCPPFFTQFEQQCVVQPNFTFDPQCLTPPPPTPACPTAHCPPKSHLLVVCTAVGPQCPRTVVEPRAAFTFFNPCNTIQIDCWFANYWANFRA